MWDSYEEQPVGSLENTIRQLKNLQGKNVFLTCFKIRESTNKMFQIMKNSFGPRFLSTDY